MPVLSVAPSTAYVVGSNEGSRFRADLLRGTDATMAVRVGQDTN